jgi:hypothetical protein
MPPNSQRTLSKSRDWYASVRCVNCRHLRYRNQKPGDPCAVCKCLDHRVPGERQTGAAS